MTQKSALSKRIRGVRSSTEIRAFEGELTSREKKRNGRPGSRKRGDGEKILFNSPAEGERGIVPEEITRSVPLGGTKEVTEKKETRLWRWG